MTKQARITNTQLSFKKRAAVPKVRTWVTFFQHSPVINVVFATLLVVMGFAYLGIVNSTAADTVQLNQLNTTVKAAYELQRDVELDSAEVLSLQHIDRMSEQYELVAATDVEYITPSDSAVALSE